MIEAIKDMFLDFPMGTILAGCFTLIVLFIIFIIVDISLSTSKQIEVVVIEKSYTPESTGVGIATGTTSSGNVGTGVVVTSESEKFILIVQDNFGDVFSKEVNAKNYSTVKPGDKIMISIRIGWISKMRYA